MKDENSVLLMRDYGCISYHFNEVMDAKQISRNKLATLTGIRFEVANRLYNGTIERMDMDVLARVCFALDCEISDVLRYNKIITK